MSAFPLFDRIWNDDWFQGAGQQRRYFEGWYLKMVSKDTRHIYAVIPGVAMGATPGDRHAFIQLIDGNTAQTEYYRFPFEAFRFDKASFRVWIGENYFSAEEMRLAIPGELEGHIFTHNLQRYPKSLLAPGIMNRFRFAPFMECYHGVVSMDHGLSGSLWVKGVEKPMEQGRGYIEKDWGRSFPSAWVWMQGNQFEVPGTSFMLSVANIPWIGYSFTGFLGFLHYPGGLERFGTYTGARITRFEYGEKGVEIHLTNQGHTLEIDATRDHAGVLQAPTMGTMERRISESVDATLAIRLTDKDGKVLFEGKSRPSGLELVGEMAALKQKMKGLKMK